MTELIPTKTSLAELFDRDPEKLSQDDLRAMLLGLQSMRRIWQNEIGVAASQGRKVKSKVAAIGKQEPEDPDNIML